MHRHLLLISFLSVTLLPLVGQTDAPPPPPSAPPTNALPASAMPLATAVLNFKGSDETMDKRGAEIASLLGAELSTKDHALMVERQEIDKVLSEQELGKSGLVSADSAAKIGSLTGAQVLVTGRFFAVGNSYMIVGKIISTQTGRVYGVTATLADLNSLPGAVQDLSGKIDAVLDSHRDVLLPPGETAEHRMERLRALLGDRPRPSITVSIPERDYTQPTIDPAAQTEVMMELQQLGFQVIDSAEGRKKADVTITGEAFSELGARHGNLVSSLGRIEIKVTRTSTHELIWTDRETQVAVDIGSRTAGKDALQAAAKKLVERIVPKLTK